MLSPSPAGSVSRHDRLVVASCIVLVTALAWAYLIRLDRQMSPEMGADAVMARMGMVMTEPKSRSSKRPIPFGAVPPVAFALAQVEHRGPFVFYGEAMDSKKDWTAWKALLVKAGVCPADMAPGDMPELHAARTTTGSLLDEAGVSDKVIAEILGHSQVQITQEAYIRGNEDRHRAALGSLDALLGS